MTANPVGIAPLHVSENGRYFVDAQGNPFFWMGDTAWPLFAQYSLEEAAYYLKRRAEQGFNVIKGVLAWSGGTFMEQSQPHPNYNGEYPWLDNNPATPNPAYFGHVEHLVKVAAQYGVILNLLPAWGYHVTDTHILNIENARAYGLWLGQRFQNFPNIIWSVGGDRDPRGYEDIHRALAYGLREGSGGLHLISYHINGGSSTARFFHHEDWLDFNIIQTWDAWPRIYPFVTADVLRTPARPVVLDEGAYEAGPEYWLGPITPLIIRRQAWWTFMAGGFHTYGHNDTWRVEPGWIESLDSPGASQIQAFKTIVTSRPWWDMTPYQVLFLEGVSSGKTLNAAMRSQDCMSAMIYLSSQCYVLVSLFEINTRQVRATWVNPINGEQQDAGIFETGNSTGAIFPKPNSQWFSTPPFWEDAILLLDGV